MTRLHGLAGNGRMRESGFTLLEVTIAVALMSTVAVAAAGLLVPLSRQVRLNEEVGFANAEVRRVLERIQATPFSEIRTAFPDGTSREVANLPDGRIDIDYYEGVEEDADPIGMKVTVSWNSPAHGQIAWAFHTARTE